ncbi:hypothetical protein PI124_g7550 [Phytophthora idaei]|nr:hypothetical protein PI125_g14249 [Phytophthora idaei]KAG3141571.1 hypothetical protein PI126_g15442 [Phytophthora idaei]KAG3247756.1 hypothetical protein PI124_g7550 [Phytophthora idaei]
MSSTIHRETGKQSDTLAWRREGNRQNETDLEIAKEHQATEKARRAKKHNEALSRKNELMSLDVHGMRLRDMVTTTQEYCVGTAVKH